MLMSFDEADAAGTGTFENPYSGTITGSGDYDEVLFLVGTTIDIQIYRDTLPPMSLEVSEGFGLELVETYEISDDYEYEWFMLNLKGTISKPGTIVVSDMEVYLTIYAIETPGQPVDLGTYTGGNNESNEYFLYSGFDVYTDNIARPDYEEYPNYKNPFYILAGSTIRFYDAAFSTLPPGFSGEYIDSPAAGGWVYTDVSRHVMNGDGTFEVKVIGMSHASRTITFIVVDTPYENLEFVSNPIDDGVIEYVA